MWEAGTDQILLLEAERLGGPQGGGGRAQGREWSLWGKPCGSGPEAAALLPEFQVLLRRRGGKTRAGWPFT